MDNDGGTSDLKAPVFDMESERSELDTNATETRSSCVDDCCLDDVFSSAGSDVSEDEFPEFHHNHQSFVTTKLRFNTMTCVIDAKGIVKSCVPLEQHIPNEDKMKWLESDITIIERRLRGFLGYHFVYCRLDNRDKILAQIDLTKKDISGLDDYWNCHYLVTEELNRQINELNHSNTGLCHMNQEVAYLYSIYVDTKSRLQCMIIYLKNKLVSFDKREEFPMKLIKRTPFNEPVSRSVTSHSESVTSYSHSNSRSEFRIDDDKSDGCESLFNTDSIGEDLVVEETIKYYITQILNYDYAEYRLIKWIKWILDKIFTIIMILCVANWLGILLGYEMENFIECVFKFVSGA